MTARTVDELSERELDEYLSFCEKALLKPINLDEGEISCIREFDTVADV
jgi:hypothetical protein